MKRIITICLILALVVGIPMSTQAAATDSYTRVETPGEITELRLSREMYTAERIIDASSLGLEEALEGITDVYCANDGTILLLCGANSRLVRINDDYTLKDEVIVSDVNGKPVDFTGARGIYSDEHGVIYICDTQNARILILNEQGVVTESLKLPESDLIPSDFIYQPVSVAKDSHGYTYVLSLGCYYGALLYAPDNSFLGFYGANTVASSALDTLSFLWDKLTSNDTKKAASTKKLPYSFVDFAFDKEGYMVTCTDNTEAANARSNGVGQIRKISPNGSNILYKHMLKEKAVLSTAHNFLETEVVYQEETGSIAYRSQKLVSIALSEDGYIFALDNTNGTIYIFDEECNLMSAFGGGLNTGNQKGVFKTPVALALKDDLVIVADYDNQNVTVFEPTEYGMLFRNAQGAYLKGDYNEAKEIWEQVLTFDSGNQLALRGLAMVYYNEGDYDAALETARQAYDYSVYDLAWQEIMSEKIATNFVWILLVILLIIVAVVAIMVYLRKHERKLITNPRLQVMFSTVFHPFQTFSQVKYFGMGSWPAAIVLTILFFAGSVLNETATGFLYRNSTLGNYNAIYTLVATAGLLILWSVCNWLVCSMLGGIGRFKEVYIATSYALLPMIIFNFIRVVLTNFMPLSVSGIIDGLGTVVLLYTFFLLCVAMITIHDIDFFRFLWTGVVTIFMMILVVFVLFMCAILLKQCGSFINSVYEEILYR